MVDIFMVEAKKRTFTQVVQIDVEALRFDKSLLKLCEQNACGRYDTSWTCPPGCGDMETLKAQILMHPKGVVLQKKYDLEDSFDFEGMQRGGRDFNENFKAMMAFCKQNAPRFWALKAGACGLCEQCTYPDAPCRFPDDARPSIEACGINVTALCKAAGIPYIYGPNTVAYVALFLFD